MNRRFQVTRFTYFNPTFWRAWKRSISAANEHSLLRITGTLYLRTNDLWGELTDNTGEFRANIELVKASESQVLD